MPSNEYNFFNFYVEDKVCHHKVYDQIKIYINQNKYYFERCPQYSNLSIINVQCLIIKEYIITSYTLFFSSICVSSVEYDTKKQTPSICKNI